MGSHVFISYSTRDRATAHEVCTFLEARRIRCWIAPRDVPPGAIFAEALIDAIDASAAFVLIFSEGSNKSGHVINEVAEAADKLIPIIPLRIQDVMWSKAMGYYVKKVQFMDALAPPLEEHLGALAEALQAILGKPSREAGPAKAAPKRAKRVATRLQAPDTAAEEEDQQKRREAERKALEDARRAAEQAARELHLREVKRRAEAALDDRLLEEARVAAQEWLELEPGEGRPAEILAHVAELEQQGALRRTAAGLIIATPENLSELLGMPEPPARVWWEKAEMELCLVPAGEFLMGSPRSDYTARDNEKPQHTVHLDAYYIGRHPVTQAQYARFVQAEGHRAPFYDADWTRPYNWDLIDRTPPKDKLDHPVVLVNWDDAVAFCRWAGVRLATEAEWEKAARGPDGRIYPWGNSWDVSLCNSHEGQRRGTTPVGAFSPQADSPYGCADMSGNAWEWCADRYGETYYANSPGRNPPGPDTGDTRVLRGGSWNYVSSYQRAASRGWNYPDIRDNSLGFRCAVSLQASPQAG